MKGLKSVVGTPRRTPGTRTPAQATPDEDDYAITMISAELQKRLLELAGAQDSATRKDTYAQSVDIVMSDRGKTALQDRETALVDILTVIVNKYEPGRMSADLMQSLIRAFLTHRSEIEALTALQAITVGITLVSEDHPDYDRCHELVNELLPRILKKVRDNETSPQLRGHMTTCYSILSFFMNFGGAGFDTEGLANSLIEIAEQTTQKDAPVIVASLMGLGLVISLSQNPNFMIDDLLSAVTQFLEQSNVDAQLAAGKVIGLFFELYKGDLGSAEVVESLDNLLSESAKRTAKKDRKERKSVFRDVIKTVHHEKQGTLLFFALSKQKSLQISTWRDLIVIQHLKWVYGPGLHTQIANNPFIIDIMNANIDGDGAGSQLVDEPESGSDSDTDSVARRHVSRRRARLEKLDNQGLLGTDALAEH